MCGFFFNLHFSVTTRSLKPLINHCLCPSQPPIQREQFFQPMVVPKHFNYRRKKYLNTFKYYDMNCSPAPDRMRMSSRVTLCSLVPRKILHAVEFEYAKFNLIYLHDRTCDSVKTQYVIIMCIYSKPFSTSRFLNS